MLLCHCFCVYIVLQIFFSCYSVTVSGVTLFYRYSSHAILSLFLWLHCSTDIHLMLLCHCFCGYTVLQIFISCYSITVPAYTVLQMFFRFLLCHYLCHCISENVLPELLRELCSENMTPREHLETQQALFKQFALVLDFVLTFDDLKVSILLSVTTWPVYKAW